MLVKNFIYCASLIISLLSVASIIYSIVNKDKRINKYINIVSLINILYLTILNIALFKHSSIILDLKILDYTPTILEIEMTIIRQISIISIFMYLISIIICKIKNKSY